MNVTWTLTQTGSAVSGTVTSTPLNATDGSCSSCHRAKGGTVSGTIAGTTLTLTMNFPGTDWRDHAAVQREPQRHRRDDCHPSFTTLYTLNDSCEGPFINGLLTMTRDGFTMIH